jgi:hypothetical protein
MQNLHFIFNPQKVAEIVEFSLIELPSHLQSKPQAAAVPAPTSSSEAPKGSISPSGISTSFPHQTNRI